MSTDPADAAFNGYDVTQLVDVTHRAMQDAALELALWCVDMYEHRTPLNEVSQARFDDLVTRFDDADREYRAAYDIWEMTLLPDGSGRSEGAQAI